jgi:hypothetical protein
MKNRILLLLLVVLLLPTACKRRTIIPDDELAQIFHDAYLTNAYIEREHIEYDSLNLYAPIFAHYGYTTEDVQFTIGNFSKRKSARLSDVVEAAIDLLEAEGKYYDREVVALDTIRNVAMRLAKRLVLSDSLIRVRSLRDTAKLYRTLELEPGTYDIAYDYVVDSLDKNNRLQRKLWVERHDSTTTNTQYYTMRKKKEEHVTRKLTIDSTARMLHLKLIHFPDAPKRPSITVKNLEIYYTPFEEEAIHELYKQQLNLRIFAKQFLHAAIEKDSL